MKNVIVTGANGFIGSNLVNTLLARGINVVAIDISFLSSTIPDVNEVIKLEIGLNDIDKLRSLIPEREYDAMYHLAWSGVNGASKADPSVQIDNIHIGINCANLCKSIGVKKFLCAGTVAECSIQSLPSIKSVNGGMMYGVAKHCSHLILESYCKYIDLTFVWMQFSNIYGVGNKTGNLVSYTLNEILNDRDAIFGPANQPYDFIYIDDLIEAVYRLGVFETKHVQYYIGSGMPRVLKEYLYHIGSSVDKLEKIKIGLRPDDGIKYCFSMFDTTHLLEDIGDYVSTTFDEGIKKTINWLKGQR